ncbi:MAG TPA: dATP/dGTP diphosphohydrolase domain-containing protein [Candidatus Acidoferrum sp.]|jgi:hypothetical protein|nr:dATP/dGTP diphosphohydrolase domain-containing protein [Candidatus Acidoferrum sp.]
MGYYGGGQGVFGSIQAAHDAEPIAQEAGKKFDEGKVDLTFLAEYFPLACEAVCRVSMYGEQKYKARGGWHAVPDGFVRYTRAMWRHLFAEEEGIDEESDQPHIAMTAWNALARLELKLRG